MKKDKYVFELKQCSNGILFLFLLVSKSSHLTPTLLSLCVIICLSVSTEQIGCWGCYG